MYSKQQKKEALNNLMAHFEKAFAIGWDVKENGDCELLAKVNCDSYSFSDALTQVFYKDPKIALTAKEALERAEIMKRKGEEPQPYHAEEHPICIN